MKIVIHSTQTKVQDFPIVPVTEMEIADDANVGDLRALIAAYTHTNKEGIRTIICRGQVLVDHTKLSVLSQRGNLDFTFAYNRNAVRVEDTAPTTAPAVETEKEKNENENENPQSAEVSSSPAVSAPKPEENSESNSTTNPNIAVPVPEPTANPAIAVPVPEPEQPTVPERRVINQRNQYIDDDDFDNAVPTANGKKTEKDFEEFVSKNNQLNAMKKMLEYEPAQSEVMNLSSLLCIDEDFARLCVKFAMGDLELAASLSMESNKETLQREINNLKRQYNLLKQQFLSGDVEGLERLSRGNSVKLPAIDFYEVAKSFNKDLIDKLKQINIQTSSEMEEVEKTIQYKNFIKFLKLFSPEIENQMTGDTTKAFELKRGLYKLHTAYQVIGSILYAESKKGKISETNDYNENENPASDEIVEREERSSRHADVSPAHEPIERPQPVAQPVAPPAPIAEPAPAPQVNLTESERENIMGLMQMLGIDSFNVVANAYVNICNRDMDATALFLMDNRDAFVGQYQQEQNAPVAAPVAPVAPEAPARPAQPAAPEAPAHNEFQEDNDSDSDSDSEDML